MPLLLLTWIPSMDQEMFGGGEEGGATQSTSSLAPVSYSL